MLFTFDPPDDAAWTLSGDAAIQADAGAISAPNVLYLFSRRSTLLGNLVSSASRTLTVFVGQALPVRMWANGDAANTVPLSVTFNDGIAPETFTLNTPVASGWQLWEPGAYIPQSTSVDVILSANLPPGQNAGSWLVDDTEVDVAQLGKWDAISAAKTVLAGITGTAAGYWTDGGGRVYTRLVTPNENTNLKKPYFCIPLAEEGEAISYEDRLADSTWRMTIYGFFDENGASDPLNSDAVENAAKFRDDLLRAFMGNPNLSGEVKDCAIVSVDTVAGITDDYAEVKAVLTFNQKVGRTNLGPSA